MRERHYHSAFEPSRSHHSFNDYVSHITRALVDQDPNQLINLNNSPDPPWIEQNPGDDARVREFEKSIETTRDGLEQRFHFIDIVQDRLEGPTAVARVKATLALTCLITSTHGYADRCSFEMAIVDLLTEH